MSGDRVSGPELGGTTGDGRLTRDPEQIAELQALGSAYVLVDRIGSGASGEVWSGWARADGSPIAAKLLRSELTSRPETVARFIRERALLTRIASPHVVRVRDLVVEGSTVAIVTDLVDGPNLRRFFEARGTLAPGMAVELCRQMLFGLEAVHAEGLVHRDMKPENVLIAEAVGAEPVARIADFGISQLVHARSSDIDTEIVGSAEYIAPELLEGGAATPAADIYAVGIILYELICGRTPFASDVPIVVLRRQVEERPGRPAGMPEPVWAVISSLLAKQPERRPRSARAAVELLDGVVGEVAQLAPIPPISDDDPVVLDGDETVITSLPRPPKRRPRSGSPKRRRVAILVIAVLVLAGAGALAIVATRDEPEPATLISPTERYVNGVSVDRTLRLNGDEVEVTLDVSSPRQLEGQILEFVERDQIAPRGRIAFTDAKPVDRTRTTMAFDLEGSAGQSTQISYRVPVKNPENTTARLARFERARVALLSTAPERPETLTAIVSRPAAIALKSNERAWLYLAATTPRGPVMTEAKDWSAVFASLDWRSSDSDVAVVAKGSCSERDPESGFESREGWPVVVAKKRGTAVLYTWVGGKKVEVAVSVDRDLGVDDRATRESLLAEPSR